MKTAPVTAETYRSHRNLPMIAGLCSLREAMAPGMPVESCVARLKRLHHALRRLHEIWIARLTAEPAYELKMAFSLHGYYAAKHVAALRKRVGEMREPPLGLDVVPDAALEIFFDEILGAPTTEALVLGLYEKAIPALADALARYTADTNRLTDAPSVRLCRFAALEVEDMLRSGRDAIAALVTPPIRAEHASWLALLDESLAAAGRLDGSQPTQSPPAHRMFSAQPFVYDVKLEYGDRHCSEDPHRLERLQGRRPHRARQLVARTLPHCLRPLGQATRPARPRLRHELRGGARGPEGYFGVGVKRAGRDLFQRPCDSRRASRAGSGTENFSTLCFAVR